MVILLIIGIIVFIFGIIALVNEESEIAFFLGGIGSFIITIVLFTVLYDSKPSAMDVYKGKTTLEITYRDSVPVDSIVVFKDKDK